MSCRLLFVNMSTLLSSALLVLLAARPALAGSLKDIEHVVIFMQENRSWNNVSQLLQRKVGIC